MTILSVEGLTKIYGSGDTAVTALDHVSFTVEKGEFVVENTCCAQDHVLDLPRMERMERALADFAKQEANKKEN